MDIPASSAHQQETLNNAIDELRCTLSEDQVVTEGDSLQSHSRILNATAPPHTAVVYALSTEDVVKVVRIINKYKIALVPYGGGTALEGQCTGYSTGSICLDLSRMNNILVIHDQDRVATCQAGCQWQKLNDALEEKGIPLFFPVDPGVGASFGGMMSTGCSGTNAVCYGTARGEWFLNATVVLPSGEVIKTRRNARKSSVGPDLTQLFIGAEGTLGVITEVTVRLAPKLPISVVAIQFNDIKVATQTIVDIVNAGVSVQCAELLDGLFLKAVNKCGGYGTWPELPTVFMKLQGSQVIREEYGRMIEEIVQKHGGINYRHVHSQEDCDNLWKMRKNALPIVLTLTTPGIKGWTTDICVPISKLPELIHQTKLDATEQGLFVPMIAHAGDGNMHSLVFYHPEERAKAEGLVHRMIKLATSLGGTCSGEHGIGVTKIEYLEEELGPGTVELLRTLKQTLDPQNLFNPGKLYPPRNV